LLLPTSGVPEIDVDHSRQVRSSLTENHRFFDKGLNFKRVSMKIRGESLSALVANDLLLPADDQQVTVAVNVARISGPEPSLREGRRGSLIVLVIS